MDQVRLHKQQLHAAAWVDLLLLALAILASFAISEQRAMLGGLPSGFAATPMTPVAQAVFSQDGTPGGAGGIIGTRPLRYGPVGPLGARDPLGPGAVGGGNDPRDFLSGVGPRELASSNVLPLSQSTGPAGGGGTGGPISGGGPGGGVGGPGGGVGPGGGLGGGGGGTGTTPPDPIITAVPEPSSWVLMLCAVAVVGGALRRARAKSRETISTAA